MNNHYLVALDPTAEAGEAALPLATYAANLSPDGIPREVRERACWLLLDLVGIARRARSEAPAVPSLLATVGELGLGAGEASVVGDEAGYGPAAAALVNGALAHALDADACELYTDVPGVFTTDPRATPSRNAFAQGNNRAGHTFGLGLGGDIGVGDMA